MNGQLFIRAHEADENIQNIPEESRTGKMHSNGSKGITVITQTNKCGMIKCDKDITGKAG